MWMAMGSGNGNGNAGAGIYDSIFTSLLVLAALGDGRGPRAQGPGFN